MSRIFTVSGSELARERTAQVDARILDTLADGTAAAHLHSGMYSLVAVGSYGRRELAPYSDVDVLVLHADRSATVVADATKALLYPLWDLGFDLGYAVRTVGECLKWAKADPIIATTLLDGRLVAGNARLLADLETQLSSMRRRKQRAFDRALLAGIGERHAKFGDAGVDIEPHIKEGRGGLRDLQTLRWLRARDSAEDPRWSQFDGVLGVDLDHDLDVLLSVRDALHTSAGQKLDTLDRDHLASVAAALGLGDMETSDGTDPRTTLMREIFDTCRRVGAQLGWIFKHELDPPRRAKPTHGFVADEGWLSPGANPPPEADPAPALLASLQTRSLAPGPALLRWTRTSDGAITWTPATQDAALELLRSGTASSWEFLDVTGLWTRFFPEFAPARAKTQFNPLHHLAVDAHCWEALTQARRLRGTDSLAGQVFDQLTEPDILFLAALLHDTGKGNVGDHSREGVIIARRVLQRMGFGANVEQTVAFLIRNHLLLTEFATGRDLNDEELVTRLATKVGDTERLRLLYLLSVADARATGPAAWSEWKAGLLDELFLKCRHVIETGDLVSRDVQNRIERTRQELIRALEDAGLDADQAGQIADPFPQRYLLTQPVETGLVHLPALRQVIEGKSRARIVSDDARIHVVARDRPGLLADIAGVLALHGVGVRTADIYTRRDGIAVDVMSIVGSHDERLTTVDWKRIERDLEEASSGRIDLASLVAERAGRYDGRPSAAATVHVDNTASEWYSIVEVRSTDRVGLLYDLTSVLADLGTDVHFAKVSTEAGQARDTFNVRDALGAKPKDAEAFARDIDSALRARVPGH